MQEFVRSLGLEQSLHHGLTCNTYYDSYSSLLWSRIKTIIEDLRFLDHRCDDGGVAIGTKRHMNEQDSIPCIRLTGLQMQK